jgi:acyl-CoA reductase-like NAD-dependent aldehyde dehydrogenase
MTGEMLVTDPRVDLITFTGSTAIGKHIVKRAARIRTGTTGLNGGAPINGDLPFGGYKHSGVGRAWGVEGIEEYLETKVVAWR